MSNARKQAEADIREELKKSGKTFIAMTVKTKVVYPELAYDIFDIYASHLGEELPEFEIYGYDHVIYW